MAENESLGVCAACVFRRQAMFVGDVAKPTGAYSFDLFGPLVRNRDEWMAIIAEEGRRMGYQWARLLAPAHYPAALGASHATA